MYTTIGPWTVQTFTLILALAIALSAVIGLRRDVTRADAYLAAFVGSVIGARLLHVLLNLDYFADNLNEAFNLSAGGLDWHGAVMGGVAGLYVAAWLQRRDHSGIGTRYIVSLRNSLTPALPIIGLGAWYGCLAAGCGYGREVDTLANYSPLVAAELVDVFGIVAPRYATPFFGMALSGGVLLVALVIIWRGWLREGRFWFVLALLSAGMFVIGFFRADHTFMIAGLRADQWLDGAFLVVSSGLLVRVTMNCVHTER